MILVEASMTEELGTYPIKVVARMTGLSPDVIRAWERRYGAIAPSRAERGIRLYRDADVTRLLLLKAAIAQGHAIGRLASQSDEALSALGAEPSEPSSHQPSPFAQRVIAAIARLDHQSADAALGEAASLLPAPALLAEVVQPLLTHVGNVWSQQRLGIAREHLTTSLLRSLLGTLLRTRQVPHRRGTVVLGTLPGESHEMGLLMVALLLASHGHPVCYLGPNLPPSELAAAAAETDAAILGLSLALAPDEAGLAALQDLADALPPQVALWLGGHGASLVPAAHLPQRARVFRSLHDLNRHLERQLP